MVLSAVRTIYRLREFGKYFLTLSNGTFVCKFISLYYMVVQNDHSTHLIHDLETSYETKHIYTVYTDCVTAVEASLL